MQSLSPTRRLSAIVALVAVDAMLAVVVVGLLHRPLVLVVAIVCLGVAIGAGSYALTRSAAGHPGPAFVRDGTFWRPPVWGGRHLAP